MSAACEQAERPASLYRRYRPRSFEELYGQNPTARILRRALQSGSVHHAYLFAGPHGTGKTSTARILAACLNCERAPTAKPCGLCESCLSLASGGSLDLAEIDAATHSGVDDARLLSEHSALLPMGGGHRVFILDEAHMLSRSAWNALLKTLEEPPAHTVFVLATTEPAKVPATIADRCHRLRFRAASAAQVAALLARVSAAEGIAISAEARAALAQVAAGSFREALSMLEQARHYAGERIALSDVRAVADLVQEGEIDAILAALSDGGDAKALHALSRALDDGSDPQALAGALEARLRALLSIQTLRRVPRDLSLGPEQDRRLQVQARALRRATVAHLLDLLAFARQAARAGADPRAQLELAIVKAAHPSLYAATEALLTRVVRLERASRARRDAAAPSR
jgi:DNA polymerase-3 subunit gamma/tau